ncbi:MAG TPA: hypothetical protein VNR62_11480, partial [Cellulomonas sp.]|nr:hypothetical protein [Cellulomonas sp.]
GAGRRCRERPERLIPAAGDVRAASWLRAYPRRWRDLRADELLTVLAEASDAGPDLGAVRGRDDRRARVFGAEPELGPWLPYRVLDPTPGHRVRTRADRR